MRFLESVSACVILKVIHLVFFARVGFLYSAETHDCWRKSLSKQSFDGGPVTFNRGWSEKNPSAFVSASSTCPNSCARTPSTASSGIVVGCVKKCSPGGS